MLHTVRTPASAARPNGPDRLLTAQSLARLLDVSLRQIWRLRAARRLPSPVRLGRRTVRWRESDISEYVRSL
jgi:predicted DNA-binding transcriptional regulator AlpA